jgi:hypothetical protein
METTSKIIWQSKEMKTKNRFQAGFTNFFATNAPKLAHLCKCLPKKAGCITLKNYNEKHLDDRGKPRRSNNSL